MENQVNIVQDSNTATVTVKLGEDDNLQDVINEVTHAVEAKLAEGKHKALNAVKILYIRDWWRNPIGCIAFKKVSESKIHYQYSICHRNDVFDKMLAKRIAYSRLENKPFTIDHNTNDHINNTFVNICKDIIVSGKVPDYTNFYKSVVKWTEPKEKPFKHSDDLSSFSMKNQELKQIVA